MSGIASTLLQLLKIACVLAGFGVLFVVAGYLSVQWALSADEFEVPDVVGLPLTDAEAALTDVGLLVDVDEQPLTHDEVPEGHVVQQNPPAGTAIKHQRGILLTLSSGVPKRGLPMIVADALPRAQIALQQEGFQVEYVARVYSSEFGKDLVIAQQPDEQPEGASAPARLLVSLGPPPASYVMPDLVYRNVEEVRAFLERRGLQVQERRSRQRNDGQPLGTILSHQPSPGFKIGQGDLIVLVVNR